MELGLESLTQALNLATEDQPISAILTKYSSTSERRLRKSLDCLRLNKTWCISNGTFRTAPSFVLSQTQEPVVAAT